MKIFLITKILIYRIIILLIYRFNLKINYKMLFPLSLFDVLFDDNSKILKDDESFCMEVKLEKYSKISYIGYITNKYYKNMKDIGSYIIIVNSNLNGPNAIYSISKSNMMQDGCISILSNSPDINGNTLELEWNKGEYPLLKYKASSLVCDVTDNKLLFIIKVITSF